MIQSMQCPYCKGSGTMQLNTISGRLAAALAAKNMSIRSFQHKLRAQKVRGSSYEAIQNYLHERREPGVRWILKAAKILDVEPSWLAFGGSEPGEGTDA